jgi:hypothetical protein
MVGAFVAEASTGFIWRLVLRHVGARPSSNHDPRNEELQRSQLPMAALD